MDYAQIIGQGFGIVAIILGFLTYQMKSKKGLLIIQLLTCMVFVVHYFLIGAIPACALNFVATLRNFVYYHKDKKIFSSKYYPYIFALIMAFMGVLSWQNIYSLLVIAGLVINTICVSFKDPQFVRKSILVSSPLVLVYDVIAFSIGGIVYESVVIVSSIIGIIRYRKVKENEL